MSYVKQAIAQLSYSMSTCMKGINMKTEISNVRHASFAVIHVQFNLTKTKQVKPVGHAALVDVQHALVGYGEAAPDRRC